MLRPLDTKKDLIQSSKQSGVGGGKCSKYRGRENINTCYVTSNSATILSLYDKQYGTKYSRNTTRATYSQRRIGQCESNGQIFIHVDKDNKAIKYKAKIKWKKC